MCELLGLNFNQPVRCSLSFRGFSHRGEHNPHGWGIARFSGPACQVLKEPIEAPNSKLATFLRDYEPFVSKIFIGHVRYASRGNSTLQNTPFRPDFSVPRGSTCPQRHSGPSYSKVCIEVSPCRPNRFRVSPLCFTHDIVQRENLFYRF